MFSKASTNTSANTSYFQFISTPCPDEWKYVIEREVWGTMKNFQDVLLITEELKQGV